VGASKDLLFLDVIWLDRFPIPGQFAFMFPWYHHQALEKAYQGYSRRKAKKKVLHLKIAHSVFEP